MNAIQLLNSMSNNKGSPLSSFEITDEELLAAKNKSEQERRNNLPGNTTLSPYIAKPETQKKPSQEYFSNQDEPQDYVLLNNKKKAQGLTALGSFY